MEQYESPFFVPDLIIFRRDEDKEEDKYWKIDPGSKDFIWIVTLGLIIALQKAVEQTFRDSGLIF